MIKDVDWKAVAQGSVVTITVGVMASVISNALGLTGSGKHHESNLIFIFFWVDFLGAAAGGFIAGRQRRDAPALHGALVGTCSYIVVIIFATVVTLVAGHSRPTVLEGVTGVLLLALAGMVGGLVAGRREHRTRPSSTDS